MSAPDVTRRSEVELFMECEEEELAPSQRQASVQAQKDYRTALQKIEDTKPVRVPRSNSARKDPALSSQAPIKSKKRDLSDVIVIDDDPVFSVMKHGRTSHAWKTTESTKGPKKNFYSSSNPSSLLSAASSTIDLTFSSSSSSNSPVSRRWPPELSNSTNVAPYLTLPATKQPTTFNLQAGRKVLLAVPVSSSTDQDFVMSTSVRQFQVVNATASASSVSRVHSGSRQLPSKSTTVKEMMKYKRPEQGGTTELLRNTCNLAITKPRRGRPRKIAGPSFYNVDAEKDDEDDVKITEPFIIYEPFNSNEVSTRMSLHNPEKSHTSLIKSSGTRNAGVKRSAETVQCLIERQVEFAPKKPKLVTAIAGRRQSNRSDESSNCGPTKSLQARPGTRKKQEKDVVENGSNSTWIPLDEYYYGKKEGDPSYREEKGEYRFKCWYCHKMLYNNLRLMLHMQGHIDKDRQQNLDLSDLTQCRHCYGQFDTPFEMQCHIEKVHQNNSNVLVCRICEKDHESQAVLRQHMKNFHSTCEMPYTCNLCNFRSSIYSDVVEHFKKRHDSSQYVLCLYCLKTFKISFYKSVGWGLTHNFYQHLQKHQNKGNNKKCICCKLTFLTRQETDHHRARDHLPNFRGSSISRATVDGNKEHVLICFNETGARLLNAPAASAKSLEIRAVNFNDLDDEHMCLECKKPMNSSYHYKNYAECTLCRFATLCSDTFSTHLTKRHSGVESKRKAMTRKEAKMETKMFCLCGFSSMHGSRLADHLVSCSKRTCYPSKPETKYFEYDDELEDSTPYEPYVEESELLRQEPSSPDADVPSLFGALGLVKKPRRFDQQHSRILGPRPRPQISSGAIANGVIEDLLDSLFPAETAASYVLDCLLDQVVKVVKPRVVRPSKKPSALKNSPSTRAEATCTVALNADCTMDSFEPSKNSPDYQMADAVPKIEPTDSVENEPFVQSEVSTESSREVADVVRNVQDVKKLETYAELEEHNTIEESSEILTTKKETCCNALEAKTEQDAKEDVSELKLEDSEENQDICGSAEDTTDDSSCVISDDYLITMDDENSDIGEHERFGEQKCIAAECQQSLVNCVDNEKQGSPVHQNVDNLKIASTNINSPEEKDIADGGESIQNFDTIDKFHKECDGVYREPYSVESIRPEVDAESVLAQEQNAKDANSICDVTELEAISASGNVEDSRSSNLNDRELENETINFDNIDLFTDELDLGEYEHVTAWDSVSIQTHSQEMHSVYGKKPDGDDVIGDCDVIRKVSVDCQNFKCRTFVGEGDADCIMGSLLEKENDSKDPVGCEVSDIDRAVGSCDRRIDYAEIRMKESCEMEKEFNPDSTCCEAASALQPGGGFYGKNTVEIDTAGLTSSASINLEDRCISVDSDRDADMKLNSHISDVACTDDRTKIVEFNAATENASLDKSTSKEISTVNNTEAKKTSFPETKVKDQKPLDSLEHHGKSQPVSLDGRRLDPHSSGLRGPLTTSSGRCDSYKSDSSYYRGHEFKGQGDQRDGRNYGQRGFGLRDYDRRDYDRRDYDRRDYDRRDYDQRDYSQWDDGIRNYRRSGRGGGNSGGYKNESFGHNYQHERDYHYDHRDHFFRREHSRNADSNRNRNNSNNYQRNYYY